MLLLSFDNLIEGTILKRPSARCKTPYVADVLLESEESEESEESVLAHTASLGCCGLADKNAKVMMIPVENKKNVCGYKILLSVREENDYIEYIGIDPKLAETIVDKCIQFNCLTMLKNIQSYRREVKMLNSRFDFVGIDEDDNEFILEVKNVPLADYVDCYAQERKKIDTSQCIYNEKISYFPDGYRKKQKDTVSPRALKHINELEEIKKTTNKRTILCYVIQRTDVSSFQPSVIDPKYREAVIQAHNSGVELFTIVCKWTQDGECYFVTDNLRINI